MSRPLAVAAIAAAAAAPSAAAEHAKPFDVQMRPAAALVGRPCVRELSKKEAPPLAVEDCRRHSAVRWKAWGRAWYRLRLRYTGVGSHWVFCAATGYDRRGRVLTRPAPWGVSLDGHDEEPIQGAFMHAGQVIRLYYHLFKPPSARVDRYAIRCRTADEPPS